MNEEDIFDTALSSDPEARAPIDAASEGEEIITVISPEPETTSVLAQESRTNTETKNIPIALAFLLMGLLIGNTLPFSFAKKTHLSTSSAPVPTQGENIGETGKERGALSSQENTADAFAGIEIEAQSAYVWDVRARRALYKKNPDTKRPLASVAKVMTAITALDYAPQGTVVTIDANALSSEGDTGLFRGEQWRLKDLLEFTLLVSSNDGAAAVANVIGSKTQLDFIDAMNRKAHEIGLTQTSFSNASGLDTNAYQSGAYGSARDMARLFEYALAHIPQVLEATTYEDLKLMSLSGIAHDAKNTNAVVQKMPALIASKTGFTTLAGGNLVTAFEAGPGRTIIVAVLGSTYDGRFSDASRLIWAALNAIENGEELPQSS